MALSFVAEGTGGGDGSLKACCTHLSASAAKRDCMPACLKMAPPFQLRTAFEKSR